MGSREIRGIMAMKMDRREFLKLFGASALVGMLGGWKAVEVLAPGEVEAEYLSNPEAITAQRWAMLINMSRMDAETAQRCTEVCHSIHNVPSIENPKQEVKWIWLEQFSNTFPEVRNNQVPEYLGMKQFIVLCNHCDNPPCVRVCPTKATWKRGDGIVMMDEHRCIGCRYCMAACPYGARSYNWRDPRPCIRKRNPEYPTRSKGVVEKCNFCVERLAKGLMPACVEVSNGSLLFGDLAESKSEVREVLRTSYTIRRKPNLGTEPSVFYIV
jgi:Fe-S-cluster-containing dehydrogenase component